MKTINQWKSVGLLSLCLCLSLGNLLAKKSELFLPPPQKIASLSLVSFDNANNPIFDSTQDLVQNFGNNYHKTFEGYDKSVLLKRTWNNSRKPTVHVRTDFTNAFFNQIKALTNQGYVIDIFIFTHGYSSGTISTDFGSISENMIRSRLGDRCYPIRLVYQMNCYGSELNDAWRAVGAVTAVGSKLVNFYPNNFNRFITEWNAGANVQTALNRSNTASNRTLAQSYIVVHSNTKFNFRKCIPGSTVLGNRPCAPSYFDKNWGLRGSKYNTSISGKDNMTASSRMLVAGNGGIRKANKTHPTCTPGAIAIRPGTGTTTTTTQPPQYKVLLTTKGIVYSARRGKKTSNTSTKDKVSVTVKKTNGRARTSVTVYALSNGQESYLASYEFANGNTNSSKTFNLSGVQNKKIVVYLRNHSTANTFQYDLKVKERP